MVEISKRDWKLYRKRVGEWQEHYIYGGADKEIYGMITWEGFSEDLIDAVKLILRR